jgi:hypothetical protein
MKYICIYVFIYPVGVSFLMEIPKKNIMVKLVTVKLEPKCFEVVTL